LENQENHIILFDGVCNFCNSSVQFLIKRDKKAIFKYASLQSDFGKEQMVKYQIDALNIDSFIYIKSGNAFIKSTAGLKVLRDLGSFWKTFYLLIYIPRPIRDWVYDRFASNRYKFFGKKESCMVPSPELRSRFIN
jgi:predicted DCC family thiol-disulfide oxidoreductase YuxK